MTLEKKILRRSFFKYLVGFATVLGMNNDLISTRILESNEKALTELKHEIKTTKPLELKVTENFPLGLQIMKGKDNLDLISHQGEFYLAFRTAPTHFASEKTLLQILRSQNGTEWLHESTIQMNSDLREPRFLSINNDLFFYFLKAGTDWTKFEPQNIYLMERTGSGWTSPQKALEPGYIPWRIRNHNGKAYLSIYNGKDLYENNHEGKISLFESADGKDWKKLKLEISAPYAEELEFIFDDEGELWGTVRFEGQGGGIVHSKDLEHFTLKRTLEKYDSALLLKHENELYLIARRNVDGKVDHSPDFLPDSLRRTFNLIRYSLTAKRTAIYHLNKEKIEIEHLFDLPSQGDTAYPALVRCDENQYLLYNYSSPLEEDLDYPWFQGQISETNIYMQMITFLKK